MFKSSNACNRVIDVPVFLIDHVVDPKDYDSNINHGNQDWVFNKSIFMREISKINQKLPEFPITDLYARVEIGFRCHKCQTHNEVLDYFFNTPSTFITCQHCHAPVHVDPKIAPMLRRKNDWNQGLADMVNQVNNVSKPTRSAPITPTFPTKTEMKENLKYAQTYTHSESKKKKISILIPSSNDSIHKAVEHIEKIATCDYEIIICTPHKLNINKSNIKVIQDDDDNIGSNIPVNKCFYESSSEYFFVATDDLLIHPNCFNLIDFMESDIFNERRYKICSVGYEDFHGSKVPTFSIPNAIQNVHILSFPAGKKSSVMEDLDGVIFNESYKHIWGDNWLSYFLAANDEAPVFMPHTAVDRSFDIRAPRSLSVRQFDENVFKKHLQLFHMGHITHYNQIVSL
jgi:hypothetical protein